jgi:hypothetical protein
MTGGLPQALETLLTASLPGLFDGEEAVGLSSTPKTRRARTRSPSRPTLGRAACGSSRNQKPVCRSGRKRWSGTAPMPATSP